MPDCPPRFSTAFQDSSESWLSRVCSNAQQLAHRTGLSLSSANGAPLHLLDLRSRSRLGRAQYASMLTHAAIISALAIWAVHPSAQKPSRTPAGDSSHQLTPLSPELLRHLLGPDPSSGSGSGGNRDPLPATSGHLPTRSSVQLLKPLPPRKTDPLLAVPPTILDPDATAVLTRVADIGLPWMKEKTDSAGSGTGNTIGKGKGDSVGDGGNGFAGEGFSGTPYHAGFSRPTCVYCPDPQYTDEARASKVQGSVTLEVLVAADGRAAQVHLTKGIGMGLDERSLQTVRGWRFNPARDAAHRPTAGWITIEVLFRLY
jgi:periplasmic protein TonB